jgi:pyruvate formate lyase activating enzyme
MSKMKSSLAPNTGSDADPASGGIIFDIKRYAVHDGPGIRTTVFFKGCPIRCLWCANPESQLKTPEIAYLASECIGCRQCVDVCPQNAVSFYDGKPQRQATACTVCGECVAHCPAEALQLMGRRITVDVLYQDLIADQPFWERSGGGVTLSGGEPLMQLDFAAALLDRCRENYVHTALDSCLQVPPAAIETVFDKVDYFLCDLKLLSASRHRDCTGVTNEQILKNLALLLNSGKDILVRRPLVPGFNDDIEELEALGRFLESHRPGVALELLPYHRLGESKFERLGRSYELAEVVPPTKEEMEVAKQILGKFDVEVVKT